MSNTISPIFRKVNANDHIEEARQKAKRIGRTVVAEQAAECTQFPGRVFVLEDGRITSHETYRRLFRITPSGVLTYCRHSVTA